jgi:GxxExxY protein
MELKVYYEIHLLGKRRVDFLVEEKVLLETRALSEYEMGKSNQFFNYLEASVCPLGY